MRKKHLAHYGFFVQWLCLWPLKSFKRLFNGLGAPRRGESPQAVEEAFKEFLKTNSQVWQGFDKERTIEPGEQRLLVEGLIEVPGYILTNLIIARHVMAAYRLKGAGLLESPNKKLEDLFRSYGIDEFFYLSRRKTNFWHTFLYGLRAGHALTRIKDPEELLKFKVRDVQLGKIVYDDYLRTTGFGTMERLGWRAVDGLARALSYLEHLEQLFTKEKFPVFVQAEKQFIPSSIVCQAGLREGAVLYSRVGGPTSFSLRRYDQLDQIYTNPQRYSREIFDFILKNDREKAQEAGGHFIAQRFAGRASLNDIPDATLAYKKRKRIISKEEFCGRMGWDPKRPVVGVMANNLIDGVFTDNWELFRDYLTWLSETLKVIRNVDHVNWFIKPHPMDFLYKLRTTAYGEYNKLAKDCAHIKFYPNDVGASSLPSIVHAILTVRGSAAVEYSSFGIPCIIGGEAFYTGFGFTHEPQTQEEYFQLLKNIHTLKGLDASQIERAKIYAYIYGVLSRVPCSLIPSFSPYDDYDEEKLWREAGQLIKKNSPHDDKQYQMVQIQVQHKYRHLLNYDLTRAEHKDSPAFEHTKIF